MSGLAGPTWAARPANVTGSPTTTPTALESRAKVGELDQVTTAIGIAGERDQRGGEHPGRIAAGDADPHRANIHAEPHAPRILWRAGQA